MKASPRPGGPEGPGGHNVHCVPPLVLASASPRRRYLFKTFKIPFRVIPSRLYEPPPGNLTAVVYTRKLARAKAQFVAQKVPGAWVLAADTVVVRKGEILGKPSGLPEACSMLHRLQGTTHEVVTAVALVAPNGAVRLGHARSRVTMRRLTPQEVVRFARKNLDKAGAYAVQEKKDPLILKVRGSTTNVVGLPVEVVRKLLKSSRL